MSLHDVTPEIKAAINDYRVCKPIEVKPEELIEQICVMQEYIADLKHRIKKLSGVAGGHKAQYNGLKRKHGDAVYEAYKEGLRNGIDSLWDDSESYIDYEKTAWNESLTCKALTAKTPSRA